MHGKGSEIPIKLNSKSQIHWQMWFMSEGLLASLGVSKGQIDTHLEFNRRHERARFRLLLLEGQKPISILAIIIEKPPREKVVLNTIRILF